MQFKSCYQKGIRPLDFPRGTQKPDVVCKSLARQLYITLNTPDSLRRKR